MSLTYTSALCQDGRWYKNPTWRGILSNGNHFFICLDDEEPPEIVVEHADVKIKAGEAALLADEAIAMLEIKAVIDPFTFMKCGRNFTPQGRGIKKDIIRSAFRFFMAIFKRPKPPTHYDTLWPVGEEPSDGVKYFFESGIAQAK